jgi:hypothetical protein
MEQHEHDELQQKLATYPAILPKETLQEMEREYRLACAVGCSVTEFQEFDQHTALFFGLLLREVKRLRVIERQGLTSLDLS